ncbi:hypothetical protein BDV23DRAFT_180319 [Aspergillus alliaceus]|uniref:Uncharacterized protein n=1 Tax=Petromyces alliaceus TaxID=209559 RepID=A0A5N7CI48_PETAA|nr:hypothetical protein BDV23DRAFT_180319 [Aspergillus alliaceus]
MVWLPNCPRRPTLMRVFLAPRRQTVQVGWGAWMVVLVTLAAGGPRNSISSSFGNSRAMSMSASAPQPSMPMGVNGGGSGAADNSSSSSSSAPYSSNANDKTLNTMYLWPFMTASSKALESLCAP